MEICEISGQIMDFVKIREITCGEIASLSSWIKMDFVEISEISGKRWTKNFIFFLRETKKYLSLRLQILNMILMHHISDAVAATFRGWGFYFYFYYSLKTERE